MTHAEAAAILSANLKNISPRSLDFAQSMLAAFNRGRISDKQAYWLVKLATDSQRSAAPAPAAVAVDAAPVFALLTTARAAGLKWPKVRQTLDGVSFSIGLAGERSKYYGSATVTGPTPEGADRAAWYGVITPQGQYLPARNTPAAVVDAVAALAADPVGRAALHGRLTGACCFCGRRLDTRESVSVGYGPVCAEKFSLPWGETAGYEVAKQDAISAAQDAAVAVRGAGVVLVDESGMPLVGAALAEAQRCEQEAAQDDARGFGAGVFHPDGDSAARGNVDGRDGFRFEALPGVRI